MTLCSGLSALIQAATSQLGHLVDYDASDNSVLSHQSNPYGDGYASSSDGDLRSSTPTRTPTIVPEEGRKLSFPELLMTLLVDPTNSDTITFLPDGKFFAVRTKSFSEEIMNRTFHVTSFEEFLEQMESWGFARINGEESSSTDTIQVFRHPYFKRGGSVDLRHIRFEKSSNDSGAHNPPSARTRLDGSHSEDSGSSAAKRRLSPSHVERDSEDVHLKQRAIERVPSNDNGDYQEAPSSSASVSSEPRRMARRRSSMEARSIALAVTTAKLNLNSNSDDDVSVDHGTVDTTLESKASLPLVDGGVEGATQAIVADAIDALLFDEGHTRQTYLKHEKELSISSFPGIVPLSKQLFSTPEGNSVSQKESSKENTAVVSASQMEAAAALMTQAGAEALKVPATSSIGSSMAERNAK